MTLRPFGDPELLGRMSRIIRQHSTNARDVREVLLEGLALPEARQVLDLGCGFGFWSEALVGRVSAAARFVGVDVCAGNAEAYVERLRAVGREAQFVCRDLSSAGLDWPNASFDLIIAGYSLYFFPEVLPEVIRLLRPGGVFVAVTHEQESCRDLLAAVGLAGDDPGLVELIGHFSTENGAGKLKGWFDEVRRVDYRNSLVFLRDEFDELWQYVRFVLEVAVSMGSQGAEKLSYYEGKVRAHLADLPQVAFRKDDAAFVCRGPRCR
jgi:SAM-dependent methyltransferase